MFGVHSWQLRRKNSTNTKITYENRFESAPSMRCCHAAIPQSQLIFVASHVVTIRCNDIEGDSNCPGCFDSTSQITFDSRISMGGDGWLSYRKSQRSVHGAFRDLENAWEGTGKYTSGWPTAKLCVGVSTATISSALRIT
eukprot:GHVU01046511.1.p1 GENE.GHVU01046511.1~~GHVU01046511.1.p1  ORF type:complete len:140 (-),score=5.78 GHVU01046511.1:3586-4005(-)